MGRNARLGAVVFALAIAVLTGAGVARADGDPASDVLYTGRVFFPYSVTTSATAQKALLGTVAASERAGYPIRVALIASRDDLGSVTVLWAKPKTYASFLSIELSYLYKGPLLIVMPSGLGFAHYKQKTAAEDAALAHVPVAAGKDDLAITAIDAIKVLAARAGHPLAGAGRASAGSGSGYEIWGVIALVLLALLSGGFIIWRRRGLYRQSTP